MKLLGWMGFVLFASSCFAKAQGISRTLSVDSGYANGLSSNRALWNFGIEVDYAGSKVFDWVDSSSLVGNSALTRILWGTATYFGWGYPQYSFFVTNHEFGHGTRVVATAGSPFYAWNGGTETSSIFAFFLKGLSNYNNGAVTSTPGGITVVPTDWQTVITAGGVNNSMAYAEALEDEVSFQGGHIINYVGYARGKMDAARYVDVTLASSSSTVGDMENLKNTYDAKNYRIRYADIKTGSQVARWLSATHWSFVWSAVRYAIDGDPTVRPATWGGIKLPDISHYLNRRGLSYKVRSGLVGSTFMFPVSVEYLYKGEESLEVGVGYSKLFALRTGRRGRYGMDVYVHSSGKAGTALHSDMMLTSNLTASAGLSYFQTGSLMGERQVGKLLSSTEAGYEAWARLSAVY